MRKASEAGPLAGPILSLAFGTWAKRMYKDERGFYYPISTTPFPIGETNDQLAEHILNFNNEEYVKKVEEFLKDKGCVEDGQAAKRIVDLILDVIEKGKQEQAKK